MTKQPELTQSATHIGLAAAFAILLSACAAPPLTLAEVLANRDPGSLVAADFVGAADLLEGFDEASENVGDSVAERALFGLELDLNGAKQHWLMLLEVTEPPMDPDPTGSGMIDMSKLQRQQVKAPGGSLTYESRLRTMRVVLLDEAGQRQESEVTVPWDLLRSGFTRSRDIARLMVQSPSSKTVRYGDEELTKKQASRAVYRAFATLMALLSVAQDNELLASILWKVVERPSAIALLFAGRIQLSLQAGLAMIGEDGRARDMKGRRVHTIPLTLRVNGTPKLYATLHVTEPRSPYRISGGVMVLDTFRPSDHGVRFRVQMLAARRGATRNDRR